jgi:hypothetical protein
VSARFGLLMTACFRRWEAVHLQSTSGVLPPQAWESLRGAMRDTVAQPGAQAWWRSASARHNAHFRGFIDGLLESSA